jgi:hypothetical protein
VLRALVALGRRQPLEALDALRATTPYELGWPGNESVGFVGALYPIYVRGLSYLAARDGAKAAVEFQKIADHRGIVGSDPIGALAQLQRARALALARDLEGARREYQEFLRIWASADADLPVLVRARAEAAAVH